MSGLDPLAALNARVAAAEAAMLEAAINLGVSAEVLQAQISVGDILPATILPPQNGADLIEILGQRVAAQLPPGVHPGETLLLQVTGFAGTQIYVRNLGTPDPRNPLPVTQAVLQPAQSEDPAPQTAVLTTMRTSPQPPQTQPPAQLSQPAQNLESPVQNEPPAVSPPREVFVAASVRQAPAAAPPQGQTAAPPQAPITPSVPGVEARIAASQAAKITAVAAARTPAPPAASPPVSAPLPEKQPAAPLIPARTIVQRAVQTVSEFLRAARLPDTPFTRMAATIAPQAPERLPSVLARLETALPPQAQDERISTLRTLIGFTSRLNPANPETLPAQISAYISNVIEGVEAKLTQLLQAYAQAPAPANGQAAPVPGPVEQTQPPQTSLPGGAAEQAPPLRSGVQTDVRATPLAPVAAQARAAERSAAISHDLKSVVLSLLRDPPAERTPAMAQALSETLITLTGVQVNTLSAVQQNPGTLTLTLPVFYRDGGKPAQVRISRDAQSRAEKLDADNFHVAFVLDTANLGTVAVDLQTTGRTVKIDVKTENRAGAERFSDTLASLRTRLEDLRYRVASAVATALPSAARPQAESANVRRAERSHGRGLDLQA